MFGQPIGLLAMTGWFLAVAGVGVVCFLAGYLAGRVGR